MYPTDSFSITASRTNFFDPMNCMSKLVMHASAKCGQSQQRKWFKIVRSLRASAGLNLVASLSSMPQPPSIRCRDGAWPESSWSYMSLNSLACRSIAVWRFVSGTCNIIQALTDCTVWFLGPVDSNWAGRSRTATSVTACSVPELLRFLAR